MAGIFSRDASVPLHEPDCGAMKAVISRHREDQVTMFRDPWICLLKVDIGAYGEPAFRINSTGTVAMLAGEPLLRCSDINRTAGRARDLEALHEQ